MRSPRNPVRFSSNHRPGAETRGAGGRPVHGDVIPVRHDLRLVPPASDGDGLGGRVDDLDRSPRLAAVGRPPVTQCQVGTVALGRQPVDRRALRKDIERCRAVPERGPGLPPCRLSLGHRDRRAEGDDNRHPEKSYSLHRASSVVFVLVCTIAPVGRPHAVPSRLASRASAHT